MKMKMVCFLILCFGIEALGIAQVQPAYEIENWEQTRTLVWAKPGQDGDLTDPANWRLLDGAAAKTAPDRTTDIILPEAEKTYRVRGGRTTPVRHVTVEKNGILQGSHRNEVPIWGNIHVKPEGFAHFLAMSGDKHTFFKFDDSEYPTRENGKVVNHPSRGVSQKQKTRGHVSHKFQVCKYGTASVEFIGKYSVSDEIMVQHGKMIVSGEFRYSGATGKGALEIYDGAILELQSGARVAPFIPDNRKCVYNVNIYRNGTIQAGSPERPLTSDAYLLLGFAENDKPGRTGLYSALGSMMRVYTTDPEKARLVITSTSSDPDFTNGTGGRTGNPDQKAAGKTGIAMQLAGDIQLDGVHFDYVSDGGIALAGGSQPDAWTHVTWGSHNAGAVSSLFSELAVDPNAYYHTRGDQQSEFGLTTRAVAEMEKYMEQADPFRLATLPANTQVHKIGGGRNSMDTPASVIFEGPIDVTIKTRVPGAKIRYTQDGSEPVKTSPVYEGPIRLTKTTRITAKAYTPGMGFSPVFTTTYVFK